MASLRETIKSIVLVSLILTAVVLSQFILLDGPTRTLVASDESVTTTADVTKYINPQGLFISFGGLSYTKIDDTLKGASLWEELRPILIQAVNNYEHVALIESTEYIDAFSDHSIMLRFSSGLTLETWFSLYNTALNLPTSMEDIIPYEVILRGDDANDMYIYDRVHETYFLLNYTRDDVESYAIEALIDGIEGEGYVEYRKISDRFSLIETVPDNPNRFNYELVPYAYTYLTQPLRITNEISLDEDAFDTDIAEIASTVFGNRLDFVKQLEDVNGAIVLMYGYGDKALTIDASGEVSFNQKFNESTAKELGFKQSLSIAAGMIEQFGVMPDGLRLSEVTSTFDTYTTWQFKFMYQLNNTTVSDQVGYIEVTVKAGQPIALKKNVKIVTSKVYVNNDRMYSIDNCISSNYLEVSLYYLQDNDIYDETTNSVQYYFPIRSAIETIDLEYYQVDMQMIPVWKIVISGRTYLFNAYSGEMIKNYR